MALAFNALFTKRARALRRAKLRAWWEGEPYDETAALAQIAANDTGGADDELFDPPEFDMPPRLAALGVLWGAGRVRPGDDSADALEPARIGAPPEGRIAVLGPGLQGAVAAFASAHAGPIDVFEWREETVAALKHGVLVAKLDQRVTVARIDLESYVWTPASFDGLWSVDDFAYCSFPPHLAQQIMKALKPGACAVVEAYVGVRCAEFATAFASCFAEPQVRAHGDLLQVFADTGLQLEADDDLTDEFLNVARQNFKQLAERMSEAPKLDVAAVRELAWEAEAWRMRLKLLAQRRLERRRFVLRKPAESAAEPAPQLEAENANAPAD
jgi:SAM-dependent methyltransferase